MSTVPTYAGTAHGEISNGFSWNEYTKQWVDVSHLVATDKSVIEAEVNESLQAIGVTNEVIDRLFERAATVDKPIETAQDWAAADRVRKEIQKVRRIGESNMDLIHGRYVALWKASGDVKKNTLARLMEPEAIVMQHLNTYKRQQEEAEEAKREQIRILMEQRQRDVMDLGFTQVGSVWVMDGLEVSAEDVMNFDHDGWKNLYASMRMHSEDVKRKKEEAEAALKAEQERIAKAQAELEAKQREMEEKERKMAQAVRAIRIGELAAMGIESPDFPLEPIEGYSDTDWEVEKTSSMGRKEYRDKQALHAQKIAKLGKRKDELLAVGYTLENDALGEPFLCLKANETIVESFLFEGGQGLADFTDEEFALKILTGQNELLRRKEVEEARIRYEERKKMEAERLRQEQEERDAIAKRILEQGDAGVLRQMNIAIAVTGKQVRELSLQLKSEKSVAVGERVLNMLAQCHQATIQKNVA